MDMRPVNNLFFVHRNKNYKIQIDIQNFRYAVLDQNNNVIKTYELRDRTDKTIKSLIDFLTVLGFE